MRTAKNKRTRQIVDGKLAFSERLAARKLGISQVSLKRYRIKGLVPFYRSGTRILYDDDCLRRYLDSIRQSAA